jgi:hypothetical protein
VRRVKGELLRLGVNSWALLSEVLELGRWRVFARLPPAMLFASGRTREPRGSYWSETVASKGVRIAAKKSFRILRKFARGSPAVSA